MATWLNETEVRAYSSTGVNSRITIRALVIPPGSNYGIVTLTASNKAAVALPVLQLNGNSEKVFISYAGLDVNADSGDYDTIIRGDTGTIATFDAGTLRTTLGGFFRLARQSN